MTRKAKAARTLSAVIVLLGGGWGVPPLRQAADSGDPEFAKPDFAAVYKPEFEKVYRLEKGQVLKRVAPPFIPEREIYYLVELDFQAQHIRRPPDYFTFHYTDDKGLRNWGMSFGKQPSLSDVLSHPLGMKRYEYDGPGALLSLDLPGDWIVRPDAPLADKLAALGRIASNAHGRLIHFQRQEVERDVVVATGAYRFAPIDGAYDKTSVHLFVDRPDPDEGSGGGSGDLAKFLGMIGDRAGVPVIDQTRRPAPADRIAWGHHSSSYLTREPDRASRDAKLTRLLDTVSKQTGLKFERARRKVPVWFVAEGPVAG